MKYCLCILLLTLGSTLSLLSIGVPVASAQEIAASTIATPRNDHLQDIQQIATGYSHTCALTTAGGVQCWGNNDYGQVGDGTKTDKDRPVAAGSLSSGVTAISAGERHTCALTTTGAAQCWGANYVGQLGDGTTTSKPTPVAVSGLSSGVAAISASEYHTCALLTTGGVQCWGDNRYGQLGDGTTTDTLIPVAVSGLSSGVATISARGYYTCALLTTGGVLCWGANSIGQLGDGTKIDKHIPTAVSGLSSGVAAISTSRGHTCALTTLGGVHCWGANGIGQLGDGTTTSKTTPVAVSGLNRGVAAISAGGRHTCALTTTGAVYCWGNNDFGELGDGTTTSKITPVAVSGLGSDVTAISAGESHTCALITTSGVQCWGWNFNGQLGMGALGRQRTQVTVNGLSSGVRAISTGGFHTCALTMTSGMQCWGENGTGQLGDGTLGHQATPVAVSGVDSGVAAVSAGYTHTCGLTTTAGVHCWGDNEYGQLGDGTTAGKLTPVAVSGLGSGVTAISAGGLHTCALTTIGGVHCWGANGSGQLGDGTTISKTIPVAVSGLGSGVAAIATGYEHTCVLLTTGGVHCWGENFAGQLGDSTTADKLIPVTVSDLGDDVTAISAGWYHTCALTRSGGALCWGNNSAGQLGHGSGGSNSIPVMVNGLGSGVAAISASYEHTCALTTIGGVQCWGSNRLGQLGDGTMMDKSTPVAVSGLSSSVAAISAGGSHTCALTAMGGIQCWGVNITGQLGDGSAWKTTPIDVVAGFDYVVHLPVILR